MSAFAVTLDSLMQAEEMNQSALAAKSGVLQGLISGYLNDGKLPEEEALVKLVHAFRTSDGNALLAAWLRDRVPENLAGRVEIRPAAASSARVMETPPAPPGYKQLTPRARTVVDEVTKAVGTDRKFLRSIQTTLDLWR